MTSIQPSVSCICVTRKKPERLRIAINCFLAQTYVNKELLIMYEDDDVHTAAFLHAQQYEAPVKSIVVPVGSMSLGSLRNYAIDKAAGEYVIQWDDDDWYHSKRLEHQFAYMMEEGKSGCILKQWIIFDAVSEKAYLSNLRRWEGSLLCRKDLFRRYQYDDKKAGEDTALVEALFKDGLLAMMEDMPHLYIYVFHGANTWNLPHWQLIFNMSLELPSSFAQLLGKIIRPGADPVAGTRSIEKILSDYKILSENE
jgi:glycosyltransferase involved in cell wall biosynthesis